ncbi:MAG: hypothetical protein HGB20_01785 [Chlorobiaceae bacterium]|nr:hypothetical protein [Chlorobiaceae bacterium]
MIIALLIIIVLLLGCVIWLQVTGWTLVEKNDVDRTGQDIRRELAQHRADNIQLLHSIRIELEESIREVIEQKFDAFESRQQGRGGSRRRRTTQVQRSSGPEYTPAPVNDLNGADDETEPVSSGKSLSRYDEEDDRQFQLFPSAAPQTKSKAALEEEMRSLLEKPRPVPQTQLAAEPAQNQRKAEVKDDDEYISMIRVLPSADLYDDIPDIENLPSVKEHDAHAADPDPKTVRLRSASYIDDIPDIEDL